ncbi:MAG: type I secretion system permease/ATPase, partial [Verrucomicrobiota bacterium]
GGTQTVSRKDLEKAYTGVAIFVKPSYEFERRSDFNAKTLKKNWFWGTLWRFRSFYARVCVATVFINLLAISSSLFVMNVYDRVVPNEAIDTLYMLAIGVVIAYLFEFTLKTLRTFFVDRAGHRVDLILGSEIYSRVLGMKYDERPTSSGALASQARSYESLREFFTSATIAALADLPFVFIFVGVIYLLGGGFVAIPILAGLGLSFIIGAAMQLPISRAVADTYHSSNQRQALFVEGIQALEMIKATRSESEMQARMEDAMQVAAKAEVKSRGFSHLAMNMTALIQHLVSTAIIIAAFFSVTNEEMSMGAMIACVILAGRAMGPMAMVASLLTRLQQSRRSLLGLNQIMEMPVERDERGARYLSVENFSPDVCIEKLSFGYDPDSKPVLDSIDIEIQPGERVALLGKIGSGKSSLLRLLMQLEHATDGAISVSGIDLRQFDPAELRQHVGYLPQDPNLLYGTLRSNLKAGCPWVTDDEMLEALDIVGLAGFIRSLPRGIDQPVAEGGRSLSGGQRQSIAAARALIEKPELLVFDEPTSSMDTGTEKYFLSRIHDYLEEDTLRTLIVATHRRSVLSLVDRVIVIEDGKVVADGPKSSVMVSRQGNAPVESQMPGDAPPQPYTGDEIGLPS